MKKLLLTAALVALTVPSVAQAQEDQGVKLGIGGYFKGYLSGLSQDDGSTNDVRNVDIIRDAEVQFSGEMTLDNGLTVGAYIAADADDGASFNVGDTYAYFSDGWGRVNFGQTDGAAYLLQVAAPAADGNVDGIDPFLGPFNYDASAVTQLATMRDDGIDYDQDQTSADDKMTYLTPVIHGLQLGVSYTPEIGNSSRSFGNALEDEAGDFGDAWDVGARYSRELEVLTFTLGAGYTHMNLEQADASFGDDRNAWNVGADFDIGAFGIGAAYTHDNMGERSATDSDVRQFVVGVDYTVGNYVWGASYFDQTNEFGTNDIDTNRYAAGVTYNYGPGMSLRGSILRIEHDVDVGLGADFDATAVLVGTDITF